MREIKFRALDAQANKMRYTFSLTSKGILSDHIGGLPFVIPMQYTGLKDKYGNEIYEGDILIRCGEFVPKGEWGIVEFRDCAFRLDRQIFIRKTRTAQWIDDPVEFFDNNKFQSCEVIGNIYENPELLKETKE